MTKLFDNVGAIETGIKEVLCDVVEGVLRWVLVNVANIVVVGRRRN